MFPNLRRNSRIGQWKGRQTAAEETALLLQLWTRPVLLRLFMVLATAAAVALMVYSAGPPLPYRVGEVYPSDLRVRVFFQVINQPQTDFRRE
jgi:hypothetical protein